MVKKHKLNVTRPEFLLNLMTGGDVDALTMQNMKKSLHDTTPLCYCVYTALMEADIHLDNIEAMYNDGESIAVTFYNKNTAKEVKELCNKEIVRYGSKQYKVKLKVRDKHLVAEVSEIESDEDSDMVDSK